MSFDNDPLLKSPRQIRSEIDEELDHHLDELTRELEASGWSPADARAEAQRRFGDVATHRNSCERIQQGRRSAAARRNWWSGVGLDGRQAVRALRRTPTYTAVAITTLALVIGSATLIFSLVHGVLLEPLPFRAPHELMAVWELNRTDGGHEFVSPANFEDWAERSSSFQSLAAYETQRSTLTDLGEPARIETARVSGEFFAAYDSEPQLGRWLHEDDIHQRSAVAVLSHSFWQSYFGGERAVLGRGVVLDGVLHEVVGVMPQSFEIAPRVQLWTPLVFDFDVAGSRGARYLRVLGRLESDTRHADALAEVDAVARQLELEHPEQLENRGIALLPLHDSVVASSRRALWTLAIAVVLVLLLGIANVAALGLAQGQLRLPELALKAAIGAGTSRIWRQVTFENLAIASLGGLGGGLLAWGGLELFRTLLPFEVPRIEQVAIDATSWVFALALAAATAFAMGAWQTYRGRTVDVNETLRGTTGGIVVGRVRFGVVGFQIAVAVVLLSGSGLLIRSFQAITSVDPGFDPDHALTFRIGLPDANYPDDSSTAFFGQLETRLAALPQVEAVGLNPWIPFDAGWFFSYDIAGQTRDPSARQSCAFRFINSDYFRAMRIPMLSGRAFTPNDRAGTSPVAIVNQSFERRNFGDDSAIGARITVGYGADEPIERTVIGVVADVDQFSLGSGSAPTVYVPHRQEAFDTMTVVVRADRTLDGLGPQAREVVDALDSGLALERVEPLSARVDSSLAPRRFLTVLVSLFSTLALVIAFVGLYALLAHHVASRHRELGLRLALGAGRWKVASWVLARVGWLAIPGIAIGLVLSLFVGRLLERQLFDVAPHDPLTLALAGTTLLGLGALAGLIPGWRATRLDPARTLRS